MIVVAERPLPSEALAPEDPDDVAILEFLRAAWATGPDLS